MAESESASSSSRYLPIVAGVLVLAGLAWFIASRGTPATVPATPANTPTAPAAAAPAPAAVTLPPIFDNWLRFEPQEIRNNPRAPREYFDLMVGHRVFQSPPAGLPPMQAQDLLLDDDELLLSSGRRLWTRKLQNTPGFRGKICFIHSTYCLDELFETRFFIDGKPAVIYADQYRIERYPSHTLTTYQLGPVAIEERKYITWDDRAVATYRARSNDKKPHELAIEVNAPYPVVPRSDGEAQYPLLGSGNYQGQPLFLYLDAPGFERGNTPGNHLFRRLALDPSASVAQAQVAVSYENAKREKPQQPLPDDLFEQHRQAYNLWFYDNVPYFDSSDVGFKRMWYYRWWVVRFNMVEANTPDLKFYSFYEGKLGFDNPITFAVPVQLKELSYLRDGGYGLSQAQNTFRNRGEPGAVIDPPGSPYWGEMYSQWVSSALAELSRVHPLNPQAIAELLPWMAQDVTAWTTAFDPDGDGLPQRLKPRLTGYDLDILSFWYFDGTKFNPRAQLSEMERVDFASFVYANARGVAELARTQGDQSLAKHYDEVGDRIRTAVLTKLWDDRDKFFYPQRASDDARAPVRELHGFFPFTTQLAPDDAKYTVALSRFIDPEEFWTRFPPVIASSYYYRRWNWEMDGLTRNIAPHPITMGARTLIQALKHYPSSPIEPHHFMDLMTRYNDLVFPGVNPFDPYWRPNAHEYYSKWEPGQVNDHPKGSDISHDFHSAYCSLVVEGAIGLTPRVDKLIEIQPAAYNWDYFLIDRLRYHDHDLTIAWDRPDGNVRYEGIPEGFSLYIDGEPAFTQAALGHVVWDPEARQLVR